jgi:predicted kinase
MAPMLVIFGGLPGAGKTTLVRELARQLGATYLRIDTIEHAIARAEGKPVGEAGYLVGYAVAEENLRLGRTVVADSVNPLRITRDAWRSAARRGGAAFVEILVVCSDHVEHRRRINTRQTDVAGPRLACQDVLARAFEPWGRAPVVIDTADRTVEQSLAELQAALSAHRCTEKP